MNVGRSFARQLGRLFGVISDKAAPDLDSVRAAHHDGVAAAKISFHPLHTRRQQALASPQRSHGALVNEDRATRLERARDPLLARGDGIGLGQEPRACTVLGDGRERM